MSTMRTARCAAAAIAVALAAACSKSSTGPSDPIAGTWSATIGRMVFNATNPPDTGTVTPAPFTLTLVKGGNGQPPYLATWPALNLAVTFGSVPVNMPIPASTNGYTIAASGDSLTVHIPFTAAGTGCEVVLRGAFVGNSVLGAADVVSGVCGTLGGTETATGLWTATRQ